MIKHYAFALSLITLCASGSLQANMQLSRSVVSFDYGQTLQDIRITNPTAHTLYLSTQVRELLSPESDEALSKPLDNPRQAPLLVTPNRLVIQAGQSAMLRFIHRDSTPEREKVYRVSLQPNVDNRLIAEPSDGINSAINVLIGYEVLLIAKPKNPQQGLKVERNGTRLSLKNTGNTNVLIRKVTQCASADTPCETLGSNRLYAGEQWTLELPKAKPASVHYSTDQGLSRVEQF